MSKTTAQSTFLTGLAAVAIKGERVAQGGTDIYQDITSLSNRVGCYFDFSFSASGNANTALSANVIYYTSGKVEISRTTISIPVNSMPTSRGDFNYYRTTTVIPSNTSYARVQFLATSTSGNTDVYIDDVSFGI
ncbi:hypothetical protein [Anaerosporobacter sp.]